MALVKLCPFAAAGILISSFYEDILWLMLLSASLFLVSLLVFCLGVLHFRKLKVYRRSWICGVAMMLFMISFFASWTFLFHPVSDAYNFQKMEYEYLIVRVDGKPRIRQFDTQAVGQVIAAVQKGKLSHRRGQLLLIFRDSLTLRANDELLIRASLSSIKEPANPGDFNKRSYWRYKGISYQVFLHDGDYRYLGSGGESRLSKVRRFFVRRLEKRLADPESRALIGALILGDKASIDGEIRQLYRRTGISHILSVSGMHISMVFAGAGYILFVLDRGRGRKMFKCFILIGIIMLYAALTGSESPVVRAAVMVMFILVARVIRRDVNMLNILASAFIIQLLIDPGLLTDLGFQLSYTAMYGLVAIYPRLARKVSDLPLVLRHVAALSLISICAQLATLPLILYYFESFPTYFLLANLIMAIPVMLIMCCGFMLVICPIEIMVGPVAWVTSKLISSCHYVLHIIADLPESLVLFSRQYTLFYVFCGISTLVVADIFRRYNRIKIFYLYGCFLCLIICLFLKQDSELHLREVCFYYNPQATMIGFKYENYFSALITDDSQSYRVRRLSSEGAARWVYSLEDARKGIFQNILFSKNGLIQFGQLRILMVDSIMAKVLLIRRPKLHCDAIFVDGNPGVSIGSLSEHIEFKLLVIGARNTRWRIRQWEDEAYRLAIDSHRVSSAGAILLKVAADGKLERAYRYKL